MAAKVNGAHYLLLPIESTLNSCLIEMLLFLDDSSYFRSVFTHLGLYSMSYLKERNHGMSLK